MHNGLIYEYNIIYAERPIPIKELRVEEGGLIIRHGLIIRSLRYIPIEITVFERFEFEGG